MHDQNPTRSEPAEVDSTDTDDGFSQKQTYFNRELSWLKFNARVLHEAVDDRTPLLERLKFLGIFTSNLDEFFMKRVGGLKRQVQAQVGALSVDGLTPSQQLVEIRSACLPMLDVQAKTFTEVIRPALAASNIHLLAWDELTQEEQDFAQMFYRQNVFPVLTPMAVDPGHPFPFLSNLSLSLGVKLYHPRLDDQLFARVKVPDMLPHWIRLPSSEAGGFRFVSIVNVISHNLATLFPGMDLMSVTPFRVTRNADVEREEEDAEDLLELIAQELRDRRFERIVRLEHNPKGDPWTIHFLMRELELQPEDVYELPAELDYTVMPPIWDLELSGLKYAPWTPITPPRLSDDQADIFSVIRTADLIVHHPFENFSDSVERFIRTAAADPKVMAVKLTLYRIGDSRTLMDSLIHAAEQGKQVVCLVELKARFDEQRNIFWAQQLERAGVHVVYGIVGLKTHTKLTLVVRQDPDEIRCYVHIGTGNYNVQTARLYTDFGMLTCRKEITDEVVELFHYLTGRSLKGDYQTLMVAPINMRERFMELIDREIEHQQAGRPAGIVAKMNSLEDRKIIRRLYAASRAGVPIKLIVRGFCCLHPELPGVSENIEVSSVIGRYLEHSRIFHFRDGADESTGGKFFIGSADWMYRNLNRRVELVVPIEDAAGRARLWQVLDILLNDKRQAWDMLPDGTYKQRQPSTPEEAVGSQEKLMQIARSSTAVDMQRAQIGDAPQS